MFSAGEGNNVVAIAGGGAGGSPPANSSMSRYRCSCQFRCTPDEQSADQAQSGPVVRKDADHRP